MTIVKNSIMKFNTTRHSRHVLLKSIGDEGQRKIEQSKVFVAGLGALGSLISILLVRAGVGLVRVTDRDGPELHNLHRQLLYDETDLLIKRTKAWIGASKLRLANSEVVVESIDGGISENNVREIMEGMDLVVDALDNTETRFLINDIALELKIPYVFGGAVETLGNIMTIIPGTTPCLRCLWPDPDAVRNHDTASRVGVLSSGASTVASMEVTECLKILSGNGDQTLKGLLVMDLWNHTFHTAPVERNPECICARV